MQLAELRQKMTDMEIFDRFLDWLDEPIENFNKNQIEELFNEFYRKYPDGIVSWHDSDD